MLILLCDIQLTHGQRYWSSTVKMVFISNFDFKWGQYMCGAPERLPAFGARTFLLFSQQ
jgi:hypothetical protein